MKATGSKYQRVNGLDKGICLGYNLSYMRAAIKRKKKAAAWFLYILTCRDGTLYTGITTDLVRRVQQHNNGSASRYTRSRLPVKIAFSMPCRNRSQALKKEFAVKQLSRKKKDAYIRDNGK
jgi:predicted GIY-YIG superfamily endonuclease